MRWGNVRYSADSGVSLLADRTPAQGLLTLCSCCSVVSFGSVGLLGYYR